MTVSPESVLSKLMLLGTVKLRTIGKAAVVAKRVVKASSLRSAEPAINLSFSFSGSSFMGAQHLNTWPANRNTGLMAPERNHRGGGRETSPHLSTEALTKSKSLSFQMILPPGSVVEV